jgi:hypothetical protein
VWTARAACGASSGAAEPGAGLSFGLDFGLFDDARHVGEEVGDRGGDVVPVKAGAGEEALDGREGRELLMLVGSGEARKHLSDLGEEFEWVIGFRG